MNHYLLRHLPLHEGAGVYQVVLGITLLFVLRFVLYNSFHYQPLHEGTGVHQVAFCSTFIFVMRFLIRYYEY